MATVAPGDFVQVTVEQMPPNSKKNYIDLGWNNRYYRAEVGKTVAVPFEAVANHFGDPRSSGTAQAVRYGGPDSAPHYVPTRESEVARLRLRYAILTGSEGTFMDADGNVLVPKVKVTTLSGDPVLTVIDDPEGTQGQTLTSPLTHDEVMAKMQDQINYLKSQVEGQGGTSSPNIPTDSADIELADPNNLDAGIDEPPHDQP